MFWTGSNPMSADRRAGFERLVAVNRDIPVVLVTPENLDDHLVDGFPLHPAYEHLSFTHRADYLRAYFLHHHGGGYSDIKPLLDSWLPHFDTLEQSDAWLHGTALTSPYFTGNNRGRLGAHLRRYYQDLVSSVVLVARSHTPLTAEWLREVDRVLDYAAPALEEFPADGAHGSSGYPLEWMDLLGDILQPLTLKYADHVLVDRSDWWDTEAGYR
ncbi:hypothetical protein [Microbacterium sp. SD291]|uniref:hypothetical protein n=1 Tax=Microbacterium sp. SD291 TaxID=2782007 RepID=UPI001A97B626|nr:hypothetical protein [Microbacterium sp. SD291]MBO0980974.1 hypothetical protein [Microbacterium sp. SD291]